jgi:hypothetical protein
MERTYANILKQIEEGKVLLHGTSLDSTLHMLDDDLMDCRVRDFVGPPGISLTRSLDVTRAFREYWEEEFDAALSDHYDMDDFKPAEERFGAILVFDRENLADLRVEPYVDEDEAGDEQEERVFGNVDALRSRLSAIMVAEDEYTWFKKVIDTAFRETDGNADEMLAVLKQNEHLIVFAQAYQPEYQAEELAI